MWIVLKIESKLTIFCPAAAFVPCSRTTTGTLLMSSAFAAPMMDSAIMSQRMMPEMFISYV